MPMIHALYDQEIYSNEPSNTSLPKSTLEHRILDI
jgi:hypothetical protein